jgi:hypothetical protein
MTENQTEKSADSTEVKKRFEMYFNLCEKHDHFELHYSSDDEFESFIEPCPEGSRISHTIDDMPL